MEFQKQTETVDGVEYTVTEMDAATALSIQDTFLNGATDKANARKWGDAVLAASIGIPVDDLIALPFSHYQKVRDVIGPISLKINGFKVAETPGEPQAGESPVA